MNLIELSVKRDELRGQCIELQAQIEALKQIEILSYSGISIKRMSITFNTGDSFEFCPTEEHESKKLKTVILKLLEMRNE